jgi:hypothetical protein
MWTPQCVARPLGNRATRPIDGVRWIRRARPNHSDGCTTVSAAIASSPSPCAMQSNKNQALVNGKPRESALLTFARELTVLHMTRRQLVTSC